MVDLLHEIWIDETDEDCTVTSWCLAGPRGDNNRKALEPGARLAHTFTAGSYFEAKTIYNRFFGWGPPKPGFSGERDPYPAEWLDQQNSTKSER